MTDTEREMHRYAELAETAYTHARATFTDFLGLAEQDALARAARDFPHVPYTLFGGAEDCERVMARFGDEDTLGYPPPAHPIACLALRPTAPKFAEPLSHRDILGALMNLGIRREMLGDIFPGEEESWLFCCEKIAPFIAENLARVRHTPVSAAVTACPEALAAPVYQTEELRLSSLRLDALIAHAFGLSRADAQEAFAAGRVFLDGRAVTDLTVSPEPGARITLRGAGRIRFDGLLGNTKKGKLLVSVSRPQKR